MSTRAHGKRGRSGATAPKSFWGQCSPGQNCNNSSRYRQGLNATLPPSGLDPSLCWASRSGQGLVPYWCIPARTREAHQAQQTSCWSCKWEVIRRRAWKEREAAQPGWSCLSRAGPRRLELPLQGRVWTTEAAPRPSSGSLPSPARHLRAP